MAQFIFFISKKSLKLLAAKLRRLFFFSDFLTFLLTLINENKPHFRELLIYLKPFICTTSQKVCKSKEERG